LQKLGRKKIRSKYKDLFYYYIPLLGFGYRPEFFYNWRSTNGKEKYFPWKLNLIGFWGMVFLSSCHSIPKSLMLERTYETRWKVLTTTQRFTFMFWNHDLKNDYVSKIIILIFHQCIIYVYIDQFKFKLIKVRYCKIRTHLTAVKTKYLDRNK